MDGLTYLLNINVLSTTESWAVRLLDIIENVEQQNNLERIKNRHMHPQCNFLPVVEMKKKLLN